MNKVKVIIIFVLTIFFSQNIFSQIYPINITTQSVPPHTGNIADWTAPGTNRLGVNLILKDVNEVNYQARLKVRISGQGITLRSKNNLPFAPIELRYGAPLQLNGNDLSQLLHYENLFFENYSIQQYEANGGLPDGTYQICFQVFDYDRIDDEAASFESCVTVFATLHKTPVILAPIGKIDPLFPQFVPVQWQARHTGGFPTEYNVEIYEYDAAGGMTPELIVDFEQPFVSKSVMNINSTIVDISDPQLIPGREYIVRVQAEDITQQNGFKNNGWSDYVTFTYGEFSCPAPFNIKVKEQDASSATISWDPIPGSLANSYVLKFRNKNKPNSKWYEDETTGYELTLTDLKENTTYEYQMYTLCDGYTPGVFSPIDTFTTDTIPIQIDCGEPNPLPAISNQNPIVNLEMDDVISIAEFKIYLDTIYESSGLWSGKGAVHLNWINTYINVEFSDLAINTDKVVYAGTINAISDGLDALPGFITGDELAAERNQPEVTVCDTGEEGQGDGQGGGILLTNQENENEAFVAGAGIGSKNLPFGLTTLSSFATYIIALDSMEFTPQGASLQAFIALDVPTRTGMKKHLVFTGETSFHKGGLVGESKLFLEETVRAQIQYGTRVSFIGGQNSYVSWDCHGFKSVSVEGEVEFCRDQIIPIDPVTGEADSVNFVKGSFVTTMPEWGDFVANVSISPFAMLAKPDWKWEVQNMIMDFSDAMTPEDVVFPEDYEHADVMGKMDIDNYPAWKGFFIKSATVTLPNSLTGVEEGDEVTIGGENIIFDNMGLSAWIYGTELLPLEKGRMGSWAFSIDSLGIAVQSNQFKNLAFVGEVDVPAFKKEFDYEAFIDPGDEYFFKVIWNDTLKMEAFKAKMELHASSSIEIKYNQNEKKYRAEAVLHGMAAFQPKTEGGNGLEIPYLTFQDFKLKTDEPFIELGSWQLEGNLSATFGNFALTLCGFDIVKDEQTKEVIIGFCAKVHLTGASGGELAGDGYFRIIADIKYHKELERQIWSYKDFKVDKIGIDASGTGYAFKGDAIFFEKDPIYGNGFRGAVTATFEPKFEVGAVAQFGSVNDYRYFFADALASYNPGITLGTSGLMLYGFGGGASYHMVRSGFEKIAMPQEGNNPATPEGIGVSLSGMKYIPKKSAGLGIKATVAIGTVNRTLFNGMATLEFIFNTKGGLKQIGFDGTGKFLTQPAADPQLSCDLLMTYDFPSKAFHASLDMFVNVQNQIIGAYENKYAGNGTLHVDPDDWYIYIGTPDAPISLALNTEFIPNLDPVKITMGGYFDAGTLIPEFPGLPSNVTSILGDYRITGRDDPRFAGGNGLMFGANLKAELANLNYAIFYASFAAGVGWDMMLYDYGKNARCAHDATAANPIGIDGWYGTGQMYAYMQGEIGINVDLFLVKGKFKILEIGAAAALQARLPNPMYMRGKVGGYFRILDGLVSGSCSFEFESGEKCDVVGQDVLGVEIVSDMSPNNNKNKDVDVFIQPQVTFNYGMNVEFMMYNEEGEMQQYRAVVDEFSLINEETGAAIIGEEIWSEDRLVLGFKTNDILDPMTNHVMKVVVKVETKIGPAPWEKLLDTFGDPYFQEKEVKFKTGVAPNYIPMENVAYSYPVHTQYNYLKEENKEGYIQLIQGQDYLFDGNNGGEWVQKLRLIQDGVIQQQYEFQYDAAKNRVSYQIPSDNIANQKITQLVMVAVPTTSPAAVDANVSMKETTLVYNQGGTSEAGADEDFTSILLKQRALEKQAQNLNEEIMIALNFRTSKYNTLKDKIDAMSVLKEWKGFTQVSGTDDGNGNSDGLFIDAFGIDWAGTEMFDKFDMHGYINPEGKQIKPLVVLEADLGITGIKNGIGEWYDDMVYQEMSKSFPNNSIKVDWRDTDRFGEIPTRAIEMRQSFPYKRKVLTQQETQSNSTSFNAKKARLSYDVPYILLRDYFEMRQDVTATYHSSTMPESAKRLLLWQYKRPHSGDYKMMVKYQKPNESAQGNIERTIHFPGYQ